MVFVGCPFNVAENPRRNASKLNFLKGRGTESIARAVGE